MSIYSKLFEVKKAGIKLQRDTEAFNYKYATLTQIQEKLSNVLEEQKIVVVHYVRDWQMHTEIRDIEKPEELVRSSIQMAEWTKPQDKGSEVTYYRRYNLLSLLDLEIEEDDDWKKAQNSTPKKQEAPAKWYNDLEKHKATYIKWISTGEYTPDKIISNLQEKWYTLSKKTKEEIMNLK